MTIPGLAGQFDDLKTFIPHDGYTGDIDRAAQTLADLSLRDVKRLEFYGLGQIFAPIAERIPYFECPDSPGFRELVSREYVGQIQETPPEDRQLTLEGHAYESVGLVVADAIHNGVIAAGRAVCATVLRLEDEITIRDEANANEARQTNLSLLAEAADIEDSMKTNIFGASNLIMHSLLKKLVISPNHLTPRDFTALIPKLQTTLFDRRTGVVLHRQAGTDLEAFNRLFEYGTLTRWVSFSAYEGPDIDMSYRPPTSQPVIHKASRNISTDDQFRRMPVGCPARFVKGAIDWAPRALLAGYIAVTEAGPMPLRTSIDGELHYVD